MNKLFIALIIIFGMNFAKAEVTVEVLKQGITTYVIITKNNIEYKIEIDDDDLTKAYDDKEYENVIVKKALKEYNKRLLND